MKHVPMRHLADTAIAYSGGVAAKGRAIVSVPVDQVDRLLCAGAFADVWIENRGVAAAGAEVDEPAPAKKKSGKPRK